jgi:phosphatidylglycerol---prolipoprotein diacylglyceryl transferase
MSPTYVALMGLAIGSGVLVSRATQAALPLTPQQKLGIGLGAFCGAMLGAKLPFALADWQGLLSGGAWFGDGKTIVLGLVGGYFGVLLTKWALDIHVPTGDSFVLPVAIAVGLGRLACFSAGCCFGTATRAPWGVDFGDGIRRHPTQLYESAFHLTLAVVIFFLWRRGIFAGQLIKLYILAYLVYRFGTEFIRPEPKLWGSLTGYQWAVMALTPLFVLLWIADARAAQVPAAAAPSNLQTVNSTKAAD